MKFLLLAALLMGCPSPAEEAVELTPELQEVIVDAPSETSEVPVSDVAVETSTEVVEVAATAVEVATTPVE